MLYCFGFCMFTIIVHIVPHVTDLRIPRGSARILATVGGMGASESPLVAEIFGLKAHGLIYGFSGFGFTLEGAVGPWAAGYIYDARNSYRPAFLVCCILAKMGIVLAMLTKWLGKPSLAHEFE